MSHVLALKAATRDRARATATMEHMAMMRPEKLDAEPTREVCRAQKRCSSSNSIVQSQRFLLEDHYH
jgi:hypothetical protein